MCKLVELDQESYYQRLSKCEHTQTEMLVGTYQLIEQVWDDTGLIARRSMNAGEFEQRYFLRNDLLQS